LLLEYSLLDQCAGVDPHGALGREPDGPAQVDQNHRISLEGLESVDGERSRQKGQSLPPGAIDRALGPHHWIGSEIHGFQET